MSAVCASFPVVLNPFVTFNEGCKADGAPSRSDFANSLGSPHISAMSSAGPTRGSTKAGATAPDAAGTAACELSPGATLASLESF